MENLETKKCPYCAEEISIEAIKCKHCGEMLDKKQRNVLGSQDIVTLIFGVLMLFFFFMPWIHWAFISVSGYEIPNYVINLENTFGKNDNADSIRNVTLGIYALFYSMPLLSLISVFAVLIKKRTSAFSTLAGIVFLLMFFSCRYFLDDEGIDVFNILGVGGYLSLLLSICMFGYGIVRLFINVKLSILEKKISTSLKFSFIAFAILVAILILFIIRAVKSTDGYNTSPAAVENNKSQAQKEYEKEIEVGNKADVKRSEQKLKNFISKDKVGENFGEFIKNFGADRSFQLSRIKFPIMVYGDMISPEDVVSYNSDEYFKEIPLGGGEGEYEYYLKKKLTKDNWDHLDSRYFKPSAAVNIDGDDYLCSFEVYSEHNVAFHIGATGPTDWDGVRYKFNKIEGEWYFVGF